MRKTAKICMIIGVVLLVISTLFQILSLLGSVVIPETPDSYFTEHNWLVPMWVTAVALLPLAAILCAALKNKGRALILPLILAVIGAIFAFVVARMLETRFPYDELNETGLTTWKLIYRHLSSVFAGILVAAAAVAHLVACRQERTVQENAAYQPVYHLDGAPLFKDESANTLGLDAEDLQPSAPTHKPKRSLRKR